MHWIFFTIKNSDLSYDFVQKKVFLQHQLEPFYNFFYLGFCEIGTSEITTPEEAQLQPLRVMDSQGG
jgi:hypothetical protein